MLRWTIRPTTAEWSGGAAVEVVVRIENQGNATSDLRAQAYLSSNPLITTADQPFGGPILTRLDPRAAITATVSATVDSGLRTGSYYVGGHRDVDLSVDELDETNNIRRAPDPVVVVASTLGIVTDNLPQATVGRPYFAQLAAAGGDGAFAWTASGLPAGLSVVASTIQGQPDVAGVFDVEVEVRSDGRTAIENLSLMVAEEGLQLTPQQGPLPDAS